MSLVQAVSVRLVFRVTHMETRLLLSLGILTVNLAMVAVLCVASAGLGGRLRLLRVFRGSLGKNIVDLPFSPAIAENFLYLHAQLERFASDCAPAVCRDQGTASSKDMNYQTISLQCFHNRPSPSTSKGSI